MRGGQWRHATVCALASAAAVAGVAARTDPRSGVRDEAFFFGPPVGRRFGFLHRPSTDPVGGVVVCSPNEAETMRHYRKEFLLGRLLAARGVAVQRFHYLGEGNSDGDGSLTTLDTMTEDAATAADVLRERAGVTRVAFVATRLGAVAAAAATRETGDPVALWEPVTDVRAYFREVLRWRLMREVRAAAIDGRPSTDALLRQMAERGSIDIVGYPLHRSLYESAGERTLLKELGDRRRRVLVVQLALGGDLRRDHADLVASLRRAGSTVDVRMVAEEVAWRFQVDWGNQPKTWTPEDQRPHTVELVDATAAWVLGVFDEREAA